MSDRTKRMTLSSDDLSAIEQIRQLKARYFRAVDDKDYDALAAIFTADAIVDFTGELAHHVGHHGVTADALRTPQEPSVGGARTAARIREAVDGVTSVHHGHDPAIEMTGAGSARGRWSLHDILDYGNESMHGYGVYVEEYVRTDEGWRISRLTLTRRRVAWMPHPSPATMDR